MRHDTFVLFAEAPLRGYLSAPRSTGAAIYAIGRLRNGQITVECVDEMRTYTPGPEKVAVIACNHDAESLHRPRLNDERAPANAIEGTNVSGPVDTGSLSTNPTDGIHAAVKRLRELGYRGQPLLLALDANLCLCGTVSVEGLRLRNRRQAMLYRFEELVPMAAEQFVADCVIEREWAYGVSVETTRLLPILEVLEQAGVAVQHVCPAALLAAQLTLQENKGFDIIYWGSVHAGPMDAGVSQSTGAAPCHAAPKEPDRLHCGVQMVAIYQNQPRAWHRVTTGSPLGLRPYLKAIAQIIGRPPYILADARSRQTIAPSTELVASVLSPVETAGARVTSFQATFDLSPKPVLDDSGLLMEQVAAPLLQSAVRGAELVISGSLRPWIDLRRDALVAVDRYRAVRAPLVAAYAAAVCLMVIACGVLLWRMHRYSQLALTHEDRQMAVFQALFHGQSNPGLVKPRLESEEQRLLGLGGEAADLPPQRSALLLLHQALSSFPAELRCRILSLRLTDNRLYIEGQARTHGDAERIASALRSEGGFRVDPPRTELLPAGGVAFTLNCSADLASSPKETSAQLSLGSLQGRSVEHQGDAAGPGQGPSASRRVP